MTKQDELERLRQHAQSLSQSIEGIDHDIERSIHGLAAAGDPGRTITYLQERHNTQLGLMYDLGKVDARIEDLERLSQEERELPQENLAAKDWDKDMPIAREDHLDWFKQSLAENPLQREELDLAEQRMLDQMEREQSPEDHLDWLHERR
jgi:hypothetical protein